MGLFKKKIEADAEGYFPATAVSNIVEDEITAVTINGTKIMLLRWQGQIHALNSKCPHASADLAHGEFYRGKVECPDHGYVFDVKTGRTLWPEDEMLCLKRYPVKVTDGTVFVKI
jgi:nitrite reductase/ring-hydroxylating ferredoxin subunit